LLASLLDSSSSAIRRESTALAGVHCHAVMANTTQRIAHSLPELT
jgi:hypothetical protein